MLKKFFQVIKKDALFHHVDLDVMEVSGMERETYTDKLSHSVEELSIVGANKDNSEVIKEMDLKIRKRYKKAIATKDIALFHKEALGLVVTNIEKTEFGKHKKFVKEMEYFAHYLFMMVQDDFFIGDKRLKNKMTKLDDYIFSQYRKAPELEENINKIIALSFSNRFLEEPRANLLSYFVFMEENGVELIILLEDFYKMLETTQNKSWFANFGIKKNTKLTKSYSKTDSPTQKMQITGQTFLSMEPSLNDNIQEYKRNIYHDDLKYQKEPESD